MFTLAYYMLIFREAFALFIDFAIRITRNETIKNKTTRIKKGKTNKNHESLTHPDMHSLFKIQVQNKINNTFNR